MSSTGKANTVLAAAVVFLLLASCGAYLSFSRLQTSQRWVRHTLDVQHALDHFSTAFSRAGRLRAQYIDSGDASFLSPQAEGAVNVRHALAEIRRLTTDNATQQANWEKLSQITDRRLALMEQSIELKRSGKLSTEPQASINRELLAAADFTEAAVNVMEEAEQRLLSERQSRETVSFSVIAGVLITSLFLALIFFLIHHHMIMEQVSERSRAEAAQRNLSVRLLNLQDEERRKFARELHDSVGQHLAAMKMGLSILQHRLPADPIVADCLKLADDAIAETRTISHLLHPPLLDEAGLSSAIRWFVEGFANRSGIKVDLHVPDNSLRYEDSVELGLFRALQESLTNVHRHSGAEHVDVSLATDGSRITLTVRDYGKGISPDVLEHMRENGVGGGVGLAGMTERLREIGGQFQVKSSAGGTEIIAQVPARPRVVLPSDILPTPAQEVNR
ncbi:MAG TPA: CHASE3 domain-containing protein [Candidatus Sulfotelmatobacter sp.]|nr:CHASE3 domain-containing protein [Candidatus Sulfotelmatobacter sp.]